MSNTKAVEHEGNLNNTRGVANQVKRTTSDSLAPPVPKQVIQAKCESDGIGGEKLNESFSAIAKRNESKSHPVSIQRKMY